ncbi:MAG TPA: pyridoxal phosphate-dependent aminotransferase [Tepidisphaeraceae bacterium]|nr:pyridoxal phosphate-dependent aminotransferase [Tepidisphaeraceae bacterium]
MDQSERIKAVQSPVIPIVAEWIRARPGTISLGQGVVNYGPPKSAMDAIADFAADPENHKYRPVHGIPQLLEAIQKKLREENQIRVSDSQRIVVTAGGNMGFVNSILAVASIGDEVILLSPYYFNHEMAVSIAGCKSIVVGTDDTFRPKVEAVARVITRRTRAVVTISPNNPTGAVYSEPILRQINDLCRDSGIYHIHDEAYEHFVWDGARHYSPASDEGAWPHTISLFSFSKSYGFASWRIGYMVIPDHLFEAIRKIQDTILICPPVISQFAAVGAMKEGASYCRAKVKELGEVRTLVAEELREIARFCTIAPASGAFYFFMKVRTHLDSIVLVERLIREHGVAVMPGSTFGMDEGCYLRIAYAALSKETVKEGIGRFVNGIKKIVGAA